jgi:hypothetical protein
MWIRSERLINYLIDNGVFPVVQTREEALFIKDVALEGLLDKYTIINDCVPNRGIIHKRQLWLL